jgi:hypothetical protein
MNTSTHIDSRWETRATTTDAAFDPAYERTNAALRRWIDGMEQALLASASNRRAGLSRGICLSQTPNRR